MKKGTPVISIDPNGNGPSLGDFYGVFFEDINHSADGGLYAQLVQNPSFEFCPLDNTSYNALTGWEIVGSADVRCKNRGGLFAKNPFYADIAAAEQGHNGLRNLGFNNGIYLKKNAKYHLSFFAKGAVKLEVTLEDAGGKVLAVEELTPSDEWDKYSLTLSPKAGAADGRLGFYIPEGGRIGLDAVSLFPAGTYKKGVLRKDLAEAIADLSPRFMRFPGGCLVHDGDLDPDSRTSCYCWENTLGAPEARPARRNNWGYNQTLGLGFYEYFVFCEQLGCQPIPVVPAGWNPHRQEACPTYDMQTWIDNALDLIEFANGDPDTLWGKTRAELGHPKPFKLKYLAIGNEEVGSEFPPRFDMIASAIKEKYPKIQLIHSAGPFPSGSEYQRGYTAAKMSGAQLIDEHYYTSPEWMLANIDRYADFPAKKPKVFLGEYASWGNRLYNALAEAAYMTGLENAAHAVSMACYAPLLCNVDYKDWSPDLIYFDNSRICRTANYYVQQMFSQNLGDHILPISTKGINAAANPSHPITGLLEFVSNGIFGRVNDLKVTNLDNNDAVNLGSFDLLEDTRHPLSEINLPNCEIEFSFIKTGGRADRGIVINFGKIDDENRLYWDFGGWQNHDCMISSAVNGLSTCLDQHIFIVNTNYEYKLKLRIQNRKITTEVDGLVMNECEDKLPAIRDLYITASKVKKTGEIIIKAVNINETPFKADIDLPGGVWSGKRITLSGDKDAENTLDNEVLRPMETELTLDKHAVEFPPMSVTVLRLSSGQK